MTNLLNNIAFENIWKKSSSAVRDDIIDFWLDEGAMLSREAADDRLDEVSFVARDMANGEIVAVSSIYKDFSEVLNNHFFYFRCFVSGKHRRKSIAANLLVKNYNMLNERFLNCNDPEVIGICLEVENETLNKEHLKAVWHHSKFVFIGYNQATRQVRLRYFDGAKI